MLFDVYKTGNGIYAIVGPYSPESDAQEEMAADLRDTRSGYLWTVAQIAEAAKVSAEDHMESGGTGGLVSRQLSLAEAMELLK